MRGGGANPDLLFDRGHWRVQDPSSIRRDLREYAQATPYFPYYKFCAINATYEDDDAVKDRQWWKKEAESDPMHSSSFSGVTRWIEMVEQ